MNRYKYIKEFVFDSAEYVTGDGNGKKALLKVNYRQKSYKVAFLKGDNNARFKSEIDAVAKSLLVRKHGKNFANKLTKGNIK